MLTVINLDGIESRWTQIVSSCIDIIFQLSAELQVLDTAEVSVDTMAIDFPVHIDDNDRSSKWCNEGVNVRNILLRAGLIPSAEILYSKGHRPTGGHKRRRDLANRDNNESNNKDGEATEERSPRPPTKTTFKPAPSRIRTITHLTRGLQSLSILPPLLISPSICWRSEITLGSLLYTRSLSHLNAIIGNRHCIFSTMRFRTKVEVTTVERQTPKCGSATNITSPKMASSHGARILTSFEHTQRPLHSGYIRWSVAQPGALLIFDNDWSSTPFWIVLLSPCRGADSEDLRLINDCLLVDLQLADAWPTFHVIAVRPQHLLPGDWELYACLAAMQQYTYLLTTSYHSYVHKKRSSAAVIVVTMGTCIFRTSTVIAKTSVEDWLSVYPGRRDTLMPNPYSRICEEGGDLRGVRIAVSYDLNHYVRYVDEEVKRSIREAVSVFESLGATVTNVDDREEDWNLNRHDIYHTYKVLWSAAAAQVISMKKESYGMTEEEIKEKMDGGLYELAMLGRKYSAPDVMEAEHTRAELGVMMNKFHQKYDVLITPNMCIPPFAADREVPEDVETIATGPGKKGWNADTDLKRFFTWTAMSYVFNMTKQPAAAVPCGKFSWGKQVPISMQVVGAMFREDLVLRVCNAYQKVTTHHTRNADHMG
ncbi:hypothetical protein PROFUN_15838 [Planoprotostelium fungivorum]|uniref:Amidase domain-containing protein n=1 Tax=Planoprotostelium fungivorum TaxID=1890364 RepID=A0A2P6MU77_9EUKA|nr:hypothetical protein PROFUN_15838 [Planoprotostelium fungivorum]